MIYSEVKTLHIYIFVTKAIYNKIISISLYPLFIIVWGERLFSEFLGFQNMFCMPNLDVLVEKSTQKYVEQNQDGIDPEELW